MPSTYCVRSTPSETFNKMTVSCWIKGGGSGGSTQRNWWGLYDNSDSNRFFGLYYSSNGSIYGYWKQDGSTVFTLGTTQKFRDPNAWYHFVMTMDTTDGTAADRIKFYVNGARITSFEDTLNTISQNKNCDLMNGTTDGRMQLGGGKIGGTQYYWNGSLSHCHMCIGYAYGPEEFGETDATTGIWKIKTAPSVSYGTNGGFWFKDSSALTDHSSNSNTITVGAGTLTDIQDNPSNNFPCLNWLYKGQNNLTFSNRNTTAVEGSNNWRTAYSSIGASKGKFYCEAKITFQTANEAYIGVAHEDHILGLASYGGSWGGVQHEGYDYIGYSDKSVGMYTNGNIDYPSTINVGGTWQSNGDIMSIAMDLDNNKVYFAKNGEWATGSGAWGSSTFDSSVGGQTITSDKGFQFFGFSPNESTIDVNFGDGYFGTTAVASAGTNASGIGIFEYDVPAGYTALCTKGLNE